MIFWILRTACFVAFVLVALGKRQALAEGGGVSRSQSSKDFTSCEPSTKLMMQNLDPSNDNTQLFSHVLRNCSAPCRHQILSYLIHEFARFDRKHSYLFVDQVLGAFSEFSRELDPAQRLHLKAALSSFIPDSYFAKSYFTVLSEMQFDLRDSLAGKIKEDWGVTSEGHLDPLTWSYYKYRVEWNDVVALDTLGKKLSALKSIKNSRNEDRLNFLSELSFARRSNNLAVVDKYYEILNLFLDDKSDISRPGGDPAPGSKSLSKDLVSPLGDMLKIEVFSEMVLDVKSCSAQVVGDLHRFHLSQNPAVFGGLGSQSGACLNEALPALSILISDESSVETKAKFLKILASHGTHLKKENRVAIKYFLKRLGSETKNADFLKCLEIFK